MNVHPDRAKAIRAIEDGVADREDFGPGILGVPAAPSVPEEGRTVTEARLRDLIAEHVDVGHDGSANVDAIWAALTPASTPSHDGLAALRDALLTIPLGANGITSAGWNRYDTDDEHVLHLWSGTWEPGGQSWDLRVPKTLPAASTASTGQDEATSWNAAIDAAMDAVAAVVPVRKVGASVDVARSDVLYALLGVRRLVPSTEATEAAGEEAGR